MHSEAVKARISAGVRRARAEGRAGGRPFTKGHDQRRHVDGHKTGCRCAFCDPSKRPEDWRERLSQKVSRSLQTPERRATSSRASLARLEWEQREADKLAARGYTVYVPSWVCDRIAVKDGKIYLVEFKQPGQTLRSQQQAVCDVEPDRYIVTYTAMKEDDGAKLK